MLTTVIKTAGVIVVVTVYDPSVVTVYDFVFLAFLLIFIVPESDHWQCLSLTDSLNSPTDSCLVKLIDVTLACEDAN